jgi:hypothetical protein
MRYTSAGFHNRWNRTVAVRHPNLWIFVRKLKDEERQCRRAIHVAERGDAPPTRKRSFRLLQRRIERLQDSYNNGRRNLNGYWRAVAHVVHNFNWNICSRLYKRLKRLLNSINKDFFLTYEFTNVNLFYDIAMCNTCWVTSTKSSKCFFLNSNLLKIHLFVFVFIEFSIQLWIQEWWELWLPGRGVVSSDIFVLLFFS